MVANLNECAPLVPKISSWRIGWGRASTSSESQRRDIHGNNLMSCLKFPGNNDFRWLVGNPANMVYFNKGSRYLGEGDGHHLADVPAPWLWMFESTRLTELIFTNWPTDMHLCWSHLMGPHWLNVTQPVLLLGPILTSRYHLLIRPY